MIQLDILTSAIKETQYMLIAQTYGGISRWIKKIQWWNESKGHI